MVIVVAAVDVYFFLIFKRAHTPTQHTHTHIHHANHTEILCTSRVLYGFPCTAVFIHGRSYVLSLSLSFSLYPKIHESGFSVHLPVQRPETHSHTHTHTVRLTTKNANTYYG